MALFEAFRYRGRFVSVVNPGSKQVFAVGCGKNPCDDGEFYYNARYAGRYTATEETKAVYVVAAEGCELPLDPAYGLERLDTTCVTVEDYYAAAATSPFLVERENIPPHGVGRLMRVQITSAVGCGDLHCVGAWLEYHEPGVLTPPSPCSNDSDLGVWKGCFTGADGPLDVHVYYVPGNPAGLRWKICVGGGSGSCLDAASEHNLGFGECTLAATGALTSPLSSDDCCDCPDGKIGMSVSTYCGISRMARFIAKEGSIKIFGVHDCVEQPTCSPSEECCSVLVNCELTATIEVDDPCCADMAGTYALHYSGSSGTPTTYTWTTFPPMISACSRNWTLNVYCTEGVMGMTMFNTDVGATCTATADEVELEQPCWPLEVEFTPEFSCSFGNPSFPNQCTPTGVTVTVTS